MEGLYMYDKIKGKAAKILKMLILLRSRNKMKAKDLAEKLGVKKRMVREYKKDLAELGVYIGAQIGRYGGYYIETDNNILDLGIDEQEFSVLKNIEEYLKQDNYIFIKDFGM